MIEPISSSLHDKWKITKAKAVAIMCIIGFFASLIFATGSGIHWLGLIDHHIASFGLVLVGLLECIVLGWIYKIYKLRGHANKTSDILLGKWWDYLIKFVIPIVLIITIILSIAENITKPYGGYPWWIIVVGGVIPVMIIFLLSFVLMKIKPKEEKA
jgi:NSS family neurotransmitter:Na+ symporter